MNPVPRMVITTTLTGLLLTACVVSAPPGSERAQPHALSFALVGDLGYTEPEEPLVDNLFAELNRTPGLAFVVRVGDLSAPRFSCAAPMLTRRLAQFRASAAPLIFTPGDNDWTDCHDPAVKGGDPLERLDNLRAMFFGGEQTLGQRTFALTRQSADPAFAKYRENVRWDLGGVTFLTLHVTGSNNGRGRTPQGDAEFADRNRANLAWLQRGFQHARSTGSRAVMVLQQANLFPELPPFPGDPKQTSGFTELRDGLKNEAVAFGKPVVLVNGDSHFFRIDKPLSPLRERGKPVVTALENFTRVETSGARTTTGCS